MSPRAPQELERVLDAYMSSTLDGSRICGRYERLAVERHGRLLRDGPARGLRFNRHRGLRACWWIEHNLRFSKGERSGKPFLLEGWQAFVVASIFGWERCIDGRWIRAVRDAYVTMARKQGKSELAAAIALVMLLTGGASQNPRTKRPVLEAGAEIYSAATTKDQAAICWRAGYWMARKSPELRKRLDLPRKPTAGGRYNIALSETDSFFRAVSADSDTLDGLGPYCVVVDELHAHPTGGVWDVLGSGMGARREPLRLGITTAGKDRSGVCGQVEDDAIKVLHGVYEDDTLFAFICQLDESDDPFDERVWPKANPNLGVSVFLHDLRAQAKKAEQNSARRNEFLRKRVNFWTSGDTAWLPVEKWDLCAGTVNPEAMRGRPCYLGVDLASTRDTTAVVGVWPLDDGKYAVWPWIFVPLETISDHEIRGPKEREHLEAWVRDGLVTATPGETADYDAIWARILECQERYQIREVVFDLWASMYLTNRCEQIGLEAVRFGQGYKSMSPAMKDAETLICHTSPGGAPAPLILHSGHPVLRWQFSNVAAKIDPAENIKPDKSERTRRIDGIVAMLMALSRARAGQNQAPTAWVASVG